MADMTHSRAGEPDSSDLLGPSLTIDWLGPSFKMDMDLATFHEKAESASNSSSAPSSTMEKAESASNSSSAPSSSMTSRDIEAAPEKSPVLRPHGGPPGPGGRNPPKFLAGPALWFMFAAQALTGLLITLYVMIMATAIPSITADFHTISDLDWYSTAYLITLCSIQPLSGKLYTLFSIKPTYLTFISIFEIGNLLCALAQTSAMFIVGRAIAGIGAAGLFSGGIIMQITCVPPHKRPMMISTGIAITAIGGVAGPVLGGVITQYLGWRWCCWIFLPLGFVAAVMILLVRIPDQGKSSAKEAIRLLPQRLDFLGCFAMFIPACVMILLGLSWGGQKLPWDSATVIGLLCGGFGLSIVFGFWQRYKQDKALVPPSILLRPVIFFGCLVSFLQGGAFLEMGYYMPLWFQSIQNASPLSSGLMLLPTMFSQIIASMVSGYMIKYIAYVIPWALLGNVFIAVGAGLMITWRADTNTGTWIGYQIFVGAGRGLVLQMPVIAAQNYLTGMQIPIATAMLMFMQYFGGAAFLAVAKTIFTNELLSALHEYAPDVNAESIVHSGATSVFHGLSKHDRPLVLEAYNQALTLTFWLPAISAALAFLFSFGLGWKKLPGPKDKANGPAQQSPQNGSIPQASGKPQ